MSTKCPRVNGKFLKKYPEGTDVRIIGKVKETEGGVRIEASDKMTVVIITSNPSNYQAHYVEVIGKKRADGSITELRTLPLGEGFDLDLHEKALNLAHVQGQAGGQDREQDTEA
eukprot:g69242.t1